MASDEPSVTDAEEMTQPENHIQLPATDTTLERPFTISVQGATDTHINDLALVDNVGTLTLDGELYDAFVYEQQAWDSFGLTLYQTFVVGSDRWYLAWIYCSGDTFDGVYFEGTEGTAMHWEAATRGRCDTRDETTTAHVQLPAVDMAWPSILSGYTITGDTLTLQDGSPGELEIGGVRYDVFAFEEVDCATECGSPGWYEVHSVLWSPEQSSACFGIFYLYPDTPDTAQLTYVRCLPNLDDPIGNQSIEVVWSRE